MATTDTYVTTSGKPTITKDADADLDYTWDWSPYLKSLNDTIAAVEFEVSEPGGDTALVSHDPGFNSAQTVIWLSGGVVGKTYQITCRITTTNDPPRVDDRSIYVKITQK
jgi:hypothetical protein